MTGALAAVLSAKRNIKPCVFSGTLSQSTAASVVTSSSRVFTRGAGNPGDIKFQNVANSGGGIFRYRLNGGSNVAITEGLALNLATTDALVIEATGMLSGNQASCDILDVATNTFIQQPTLVRP